MTPAATLFAQSMLIGLSIAAPVGQIGVLAIQRTLQHGARSGLATGLGAALADAVYGAIGAFGVVMVTDWLLGARAWLHAFGALFLSVIAWRTWRQPPAQRGSAPPGGGALLRQMGGTFLLTLSNPSTILSFIAVFGMLAGRSAAPASPWVMVGGVLLGSALWWFVLAGAVARLRSRFDARWQQRVNRMSALLLGSFAVWQLLALGS
ncbi:LysE family transporter [Aquincola sp. MAHUQ-54]|uniref:LysE family transporter n=1 Tax=Aquincola agrisoli TaxID=3119538 RepID=A0AAW9QFG6_9BURK